MTFFGSLGNSPLFWIFTLLSAVYFINGLRLGYDMWQRRDAFSAEPLEPWKKQWSERAAFLLAVPPGVFVHELFHALAALAFGGKIVDVGFGFYWGYVQPVGSFTPAQNWFISIAGTLGTLLYGTAVWLYLRQNRSSAWRYFGLRILRFHLWYALLYYPLFTLFTFIGDWRTIYDFAATPILSGITLVVHLSALGFFWWSDRQGWYEMPAFASVEDRERFKQLQRREAEAPQSEEVQLQMIDQLRRSGATREARERARFFVRDHPRSAIGHLLLGVLTAESGRTLSHEGREHLEQALQLGLGEGRSAAVAHAMLGEDELRRERWDSALRHFDAAVAVADDGQAQQAHLYYLRALTQRRRGRYDAARQDIDEAIRLVQGTEQKQALARYEHERETINHHRGSGAA
jgi:tetratricopeptide (TPR) repeat protein